MIIPAHVWHAHQNVGAEEAFFVSMPTRAYDHASPDVHRLPLDNDVIRTSSSNGLDGDPQRAASDRHHPDL